MPSDHAGLASARDGADMTGDFKIVAIGASAGGLEAATKLLDALPAPTGMAFIFVQHLDPNHQSLLVDLLARRAALTVVEAIEGAAIAREHLYVIPPGKNLSVQGGLLRLSAPTAPRGARLPFDFLLASPAEAFGARVVCVVLSGTGADGSAGARAVKRAGGRVIAQDPADADYPGMPQSAIATGAVDQVLPAAAIPAALTVEPARDEPGGDEPGGDEPGGAGPTQPTEGLGEVIEILRANSAHDFTHYKPGTLLRRIERRMAMAGIPPSDIGRYAGTLRTDAEERARLARDLLIHVTRFFRDPAAFALLSEETVPELLRKADRQLRVWVAGCSTGEEAYSLAMLFHERIAADDRAKLQMFASDIDADAVATARAGLYPAAIKDDVSPERLARFFTEEPNGYRITPELRAMVVFTTQDLLRDPPFSRLDLVSCRNLMIYLEPAAQAKAISMFHFALNENSFLLLGGAETAGVRDDRFAVVSKSAGLFRHVGRRQPGDIDFGPLAGKLQAPPRPGRAEAPSRQSVLAALCARLVIAAHAPAAVLCTRAHEYLFSLGPTERYLRVAPGQPTQDLLDMVREDTRIRLRLAIERAVAENAPVSVPGGRTKQDGRTVPFAIEVRPVDHDGEALLLVCFLDEAARERPPARPADGAHVAELERELETTRAELQSAIRNLDQSSQEQKAINEEALSVNEEFQSTNEELLTSKEELQSLNEELTALNSQLQGTLEQQRITSNDMQNVLNSTDVGTLFLDKDLKIRFFTPATRALFSIIEGDVGRPLADLRSLANDALLDADARDVLARLAPVEREVAVPGGAWFRRRILPYRTHDGGVQGVVITFNDITRRKQAARALEDAKLEAERANTAKSRFLAAASHDLRQPLQTLVLLQGLLANGVEGDGDRRLVARLDETLAAMSGMLNTLLDINQIEAGVVTAEVADVPLSGLFDRLRDEFGYAAEAKGLRLRVAPCSLVVRSDPRLLEQMVRNLVSNALKYTSRGGVLLGCRRGPGALSLQVWDTGVGIEAGQLGAIFDEYHQVDNPARERSRGLGLGLSIVRRLGALLGHAVRVDSRPGRGSMFAIEVPLAAPSPAASVAPPVPPAPARAAGSAVLVVEDDPAILSLLELLLAQAGHRVGAAADAAAALRLAAGGFRPDIVLSDYNLPNGSDGLALAAALRDRFGAGLPVIVLSGDVSGETAAAIAAQACIRLDKPVRPAELTAAIAAATRPAPAAISIVDDDANVRGAIRAALEQDGRAVADFPTGEAFLAAHRPGRGGCLLVDAILPGIGGLDLLRRLRAAGDDIPAIMITGNGDVRMAVAAMKAGASDFVEKPVAAIDLIAIIERATERSRDADKRRAWREEARAQVAGLTPRQREVMAMVLAGQPSKNIAADIGISQRTVENHRASIMRKTGATSLPALARLALAASGSPAEPAPHAPPAAPSATAIAAAE